MSEQMDWSQWWFLNGGQIHQAWKRRQWTLLREIAQTKPKAAWDHQQVKIDALKAECDRLREALRYASNNLEHLVNEEDRSQEQQLIRAIIEDLDDALKQRGDS